MKIISVIIPVKPVFGRNDVMPLKNATHWQDNWIECEIYDGDLGTRFPISAQRWS